MQGYNNYSNTDFEEFSLSSITTTFLSEDKNKEIKFNVEDFMKNAKIVVKFINNSNNPDPQYAHEGDSGFDLRAFIDSRVIIKPGKRALISTGLYFELPESYEMQVRPRSGLANKNGVLTSFGTVDNAYRGEILINLFNFGDEDFIVNSGDRIAQGVLVPRLSTEFGRLERVDELSDTKRSADGFGSTGIK